MTTRGPLAGALLWAACLGCGGDAVPAPASPPAPVPAPDPDPDPDPAPHPHTAPDYPAPFTTEPAPVRGTVTLVIDGDTFDIALPSGKIRLRLLGVDTPEKETEHTHVEPWGPEVSLLVRERLAGKTVEVIANLAGTDAYGRVLGYVALDGQDLGAWLLEQGYAERFRRAAHPRRERYRELEAAAREARRGVWGPPPPAPAFIGNRHSKLLHAPTCRWLPAESNRVPFDSRAAATAAGYRPHRDCVGGD